MIYKIQLLRCLYVLTLVVGLSFSSHAEMETVHFEHSSLNVSTDKTQIKAGGDLWVLFHIKLESGWHTYGQNPGDTGVAPFFQITLPSGFTVSDIAYFPPQKIQIDTFTTYGYKNNAYFLAKVDAPNHHIDQVPLKVHAKWLICKDICVPQEADLKLSFSVSNRDVNSREAKAIAEKIKALQDIPSERITPLFSDFPVITAVLFAFLGGLLLNIMPCVFPILTLKVLSLTKLKGHASKERILHGAVYSLGIILAFLALAFIIVSLTMAGHFVGWGFQMQSPLFLTLMTYILFLVALNLFGLFEFILPVTIDVEPGSPSSLRASFLTGLLITLIATPCTAPFMAPAIGFALTQSMPVVFAIFASLGLGLASPFLLVTLFPVFIRFIPKPGPWLLRFKQCLAFPMLLGVLWLLWVLMSSTSAAFVLCVLGGILGITFYVWFIKDRIIKSSVNAILFTLVIGLCSLPFFAFKPIHADNQTHALLELLNNPETNTQNRLVIVTADWCITCKLFEKWVFEDPEVRAYLQAHNITPVILDWTKPDPKITAYLRQFGRSGVPLYVYYAKGRPPRVLPSVVTKDSLITTLSDNTP